MRQESRSYTALYFHLIQEISRADIGQSIWRWIKLLIAFGWVLVGIIWLFNLEQWLILLLAGSIISLFFIVVGIVVGLFYIIWSGSQDPLRHAPLLTAKLLTAVPCPHSTNRGLNSRDIQYLQQAASVEQNAADWRGNFVNLTVVGLILGTVSLILQPPEYIVEWQKTAGSTAETAVVLRIPWANWTWPPAIAVGSNLFSITMFTLLAVLILIQLARYTAKFLLSESPNRIILLACNDALALLEANHLTAKTTLTMAEKRRLSLQMGYRFHSHMTTAPLLFIDDANRGWYLEPINPSPIQKWINTRMKRIWQRTNKS